MGTKLYEINVKLSQDDKENIFNAFINHEPTQLVLKSDAIYGNDTILVPHKIVKTGEEGYILDERTFYEMSQNGYFIIPSEEGRYKLFTPPTVVENLEKAREDNKGLVIDLDYSLLTYSTGLAVIENMLKLMKNS